MAKQYPDGLKANMICLILGLFFVCVYYFVVWRENKRRDALGLVAQEE